MTKELTQEWKSGNLTVGETYVVKLGSCPKHQYMTCLGYASDDYQRLENANFIIYSNCNYNHKVDIICVAPTYNKYLSLLKRIDKLTEQIKKLKRSNKTH